MAKSTRPSIRLVAERARVSVATVSNVLNDKPTVSPEIVARVRQTVKELGYVVDISASRLRSGQSRLAAVVVPDLANPMFATFVSTLENAARLDGFDLVVVSARNSTAEEADRLLNLRAWRPAGLIIIPCDGRLLSRLPDTGLGPVVVADRIPDDPGFDLIAVDNGPASAAVARAIEAAGHSECLVLGTSLGISNIRERWEGACSGCSHMELELMEVGLNDTARMEQLEARLRSPDRPRALFSLDHGTTLTVYRMLAEIGLRIPEDIALASFDETDWMELVSPGITAARQPVAEMADCAWALLKHRIRGDASTETQQHRRLHCIITTRGSTAGPDARSAPCPGNSFDPERQENQVANTPISGGRP